MALPILDGNQSATTLSSILTSGEHIPAHTVVSLGTQAITDMRGAVSGSVVSISNFPATQPVSIASVTVGNSVTIASLPALAAGTANIGVVTMGNIRRSGDGALSQLSTEIGSGYLLNRSYLGAGTEQIGSVTASISGTVPISISSVTVGNSVTIGSLPLIGGTVTANLSKGDTEGNPLFSYIVDPYSDLVYASDYPFPIYGTVTAVNHQGTAVTTSNFTSTTPSTILASANSGREVLTIFNEGAGNLHICAGATCTTIAYQVRLSAGDYYEVPLNQTSLTHSAVFATAGTARVTQVS